VQSMVWREQSQKQGYLSDKNKLIVCTFDEKIRQITFFERCYSCVSISNQGELAYTLLNEQLGDKKFIVQTLDTTEGKLSKEKINLKQLSYNLDRVEQDKLSLESYEEESGSLGLLRDMHQLILRRIEGGYHLDTIEHNSCLLTLFSQIKHIYSPRTPAGSVIKSLKTFWDFMGKIEKLCDHFNRA